MGVWIEIPHVSRTYRISSGHTLYGCVDWNSSDHRPTLCTQVTPFMGVWIEIPNDIGINLSEVTSHPLWVCGLKCHSPAIYYESTLRHTLYGCVDWNRSGIGCPSLSNGHTLYGCVDWNHISKVCTNGAYQSHPLWVCGLKSFLSLSPVHWQMSHPLWVCGLKLPTSEP